ncbi:MAG TPA: FAD-dependent thymidylate synthase [Candidatus Angelobacter sp.]|nr:FAD-dependent thymidylate synthase [Candidatus Angelobacter sp.]
MGIKIKVIGSTKLGYKLPIEKAIYLGGKAAAICYMSSSFKAILNEPVDKTFTRAYKAIESGHHSIFGHANFVLYIENIPKILAMILNNEREYNTSEKSARYTQMKPKGLEKKLYDKWLAILKQEILFVYPKKTVSEAEKLAQENARYLTSIFTPTKMAYSTNFRQLNYILNWFEKFVAAEYQNDFFEKIKPYMIDFIDKMKFIYSYGLNDESEKGELSLFDDRCTREEYFGEVYCTTYLGSFAQLAQTHRHRTIDYRIKIPLYLNKPQYYIPLIIANSSRSNLKEEWLRNIDSVSNLYPQGMMVSITERGTYEKFIKKAQKRLCSKAQLEISLQTRRTLQNYLCNTVKSNPDVCKILEKYNHDSRCDSGYRCINPCEWGSGQLRRLI